MMFVGSTVVSPRLYDHVIDLLVPPAGWAVTPETYTCSGSSAQPRRATVGTFYERWALGGRPQRCPRGVPAQGRASLAAERPCMARMGPTHEMRVSRPTGRAHLARRLVNSDARPAAHAASAARVGKCVDVRNLLGTDLECVSRAVQCPHKFVVWRPTRHFTPSRPHTLRETMPELVAVVLMRATPTNDHCAGVGAHRAGCERHLQAADMHEQSQLHLLSWPLLHPLPAGP